MIRIVCVGKVKRGPLREAISDYEQRIGRFARFEATEVPDSIPETEATAILEKVRGTVIACDIGGEPWSSEDLARLLGRDGSPCFVVGGPDGLDSRVTDAASARFSMGALTLPHELARLVLTEQIYRGLTILRGHPYHR